MLFPSSLSAFILFYLATSCPPQVNATSLPKRCRSESTSPPKKERGGEKGVGGNGVQPKPAGAPLSRFVALHPMAEGGRGERGKKRGKMKCQLRMLSPHLLAFPFDGFHLKKKKGEELSRLIIPPVPCDRKEGGGG